MKKLLLAGTLLASFGAGNAYAGKPADPPPPVCVGNFCLVDPDKDDVKMFIGRDDDKGRVDSLHAFGSLIKNTDDKDISIDSTTLFSTGQGFANIKPTDDVADPLRSITFTPTKGIDLDGFFMSAQLEDQFNCKGKDCPPDPATPVFMLTVNSGETTEATFTFDIGKFNGDVHDNGFDEAIEGKAGTRIDSVIAWIDADNPFVSFKEIKQVTWSPCLNGDVNECVTIGTHGAVPEPSTWIMGLLGFAGVGALALRRRQRMSMA